MSEEKRNKETGKGTAKACCPPETMQEFFQKMGGCCSGQGEKAGFTDMMKGMMERCCGKEPEGTKTGEK